MRQNSTIKVVVHYPSTPEGKEALATKVAKAHAEAVLWRLNYIDTNKEHRQQLLDAVLKR